jgi:glycosyltransferase involved in cell wall biosynthesis
MKVLHVPFCYYPDAVGGTEIYVASLARAQRDQGCSVAIAAPGPEGRTYSHDGFDVHRFAVAKTLTLRELYGEGDREAAAGFLKILECTQPDILHLHALTSGVSASIARAARERGIPVVFTYHTPAATCMRGTMMRWGIEVCDGEMQVGRCSACMLQSKGVPLTASRMLGSLPRGLGALAGNAGLSGGFWTAFRATELAGLRHSAARGLLNDANRIVAVCEWVRGVLLANGVPKEKIVLSRQGVPYPVGVATDVAREGMPVRFAFLGRLDAVKGLPTLIDAFLASPGLRATLDVFAVIQGEQGERMRTRLLDRIGDDDRIRFEAPIDAADVVSRLRSYDVLAVPSQWLETGPLVVYEAFAAGIPVLGSRLGGIAELVTDGENGVLVDYSSVTSWAKAIRRLVDEPALLAKLKSAPKPIRTMKDAADEMQAVYAAVGGKS